ncbi:MAG: carboxypeptidase M32 [Candidatus Thermoplasmatota archaeon]
MEKYREIALVDSTAKLLYWDTQTYMPHGATSLRGSQSGLLAELRHEMLTSKELASLLEESEGGKDSYDVVQQMNLHLLRREHEIECSLSENLVAEFEKQKTRSWSAWAKAKSNRDWKLFEPDLKKIVDLSIRRAEATMHARGASCVYDAMMDDFDMGASQSQVSMLLTDLRTSLDPLIWRYSEASKEADTSILRRRVPTNIQRDMVRDVVGLIGYDTLSDNAHGRIDEAEHPFTSGYYDDVRITVHYDEDYVFDALLSGLHEAGHGLYNQNLDRSWIYQPVGKAASIGVHEAMSRFAENMIGLSPNFWTYYFPKFKEVTGNVFADVHLEDLVRALNKVQPSKIRMNADELTYNLHIVIRFEIERDLFSGKVDVSELPQVWNDLYDKYLQIEFDHDGEGVLQDVTWSVGAFGYWQCFSKGDVYRGMFARKMEEDIGAWSSEIEDGRFDTVMLWLRDRVQRLGSLYNPQELVEKATGTSPTVEPFVRYLAQKHASLWR